PRATRPGAAGARFTGNTPAATAGGSATISATSGPRSFIPHRTPANRNPGTLTRWAPRASLTAPRPAGAGGALEATPAGPCARTRPTGGRDGSKARTGRGPGAERAPPAPAGRAGASRSPGALLVLLPAP